MFYFAEQSCCQDRYSQIPVANYAKFRSFRWGNQEVCWSSVLAWLLSTIGYSRFKVARHTCKFTMHKWKFFLHFSDVIRTFVYRLIGVERSSPPMRIHSMIRSLDGNSITWKPETRLLTVSGTQFTHLKMANRAWTTTGRPERVLVLKNTLWLKWKLFLIYRKSYSELI